MDFFFDAAQQFLDWITTEQYTFWQEWFAAFMIQATVWAIEFKLWSLQFAWGVAQAVLVQLDVSTTLNNAWSSTDSYVLGWLTYLRVPDAVHLILTSYTTKFTLRFMGL